MIFAYVQKSQDIYTVYIGVGKIRDKSDESPIEVLQKSYKSLCKVFAIVLSRILPLSPISLCYRGHHRAHHL